MRKHIAAESVFYLGVLLFLIVMFTTVTGRKGIPMPPAPTVTLYAQASEIIGPTDAIGFDYVDVDYQNSQVNRFEASYDGAPFTGLNAAVYQNANGVTTYRFVPPQTNGTHTVAVRACNSIECGAATSPFGFAFPVVNPPTPNAPTNLRKVPRG